MKERQPGQRGRRVDPQQLARSAQERGQPGAVAEERHRQEHERTEREGDDGDDERVNALEETAEVHVAQRGQADEEDREQEPGGLAISHDHRRTGIRPSTAIRAESRG